MSEPSSREMLAALDRAHPRRFFLAGHVDPPPADRRLRRHRRHVSSDRVLFLHSLGGDELFLYLDDGTRIRTEGIVIGELVKRFSSAGYRFAKPHTKYGARYDLVDRIEIDRPPPDPSDEELPPLDGVRLSLDAEAAGGKVLASSAPLAVVLARTSKPTPKLSSLRLNLVYDDHEERCPIGEKRARERVRQGLEEMAANGEHEFRLEHPVPDSERAAKLRDAGIVTIGADEFWPLVLSSRLQDPAARKAFKQRWMVQNLPVKDALRYFRFVSKPGEINKPLAIRNIFWQVHQWLQRGLIESVAYDHDFDDDEQGDDDWDWFDDEPNIRKVWYRYTKVALKRWGVFEKEKDSDLFLEVLTDLVRREDLLRYRDFAFLDHFADKHELGDEHPELLIVTEKSGMGNFAKQLAKRIGASHLILSGEPPHITMENLTGKLADRLDLSKTHLRVFGVVDFNLAGANILRSVAEDLAYFGRDYKLKAVSAYNLVRVEDITDDQVEDFRAPQVQYREYWVYSGGKRIKGMKFESGNVAFLTRAQDWFTDEVNDSRFHYLGEHEPGLGEEIYYGIEVDNLSRRRMFRRLMDTLEEIGVRQPRPSRTLTAEKRPSKDKLAAALRWFQDEVETGSIDHTP